MNWVGGSRRRIMLTKERRKQKDFFEKEKLKSKMKLLGASPLKSPAVSLDLLNLYVVNQISTKKENAENIRKPIHVDINRETQIPLRKQNVEFPKSPECQPPKLSLDDLQHRMQEEILDSRRKYLYEKARVHSEELGSSWPVNNNEDFWLSASAYRPEGFPAPDSEVPVGLYFQQLTSPGYGYSIDKDSGNSQANEEESLFHTANDQIKTNPDANFPPIASLFEEENQFLAFPPSRPYCSFANQSHIDQLFPDFGDAREICSKPSLYDGEETHQVIGPAHRAAERDLTSILTAPEMICSVNNQNLHAMNQNPGWNQFKHCSSQKRNPVEFSEPQKLTTFFDTIGGFKNQKKYTKAPKPIKSYLKNRKKGPSDPHMDYLKIFERETLDKEVSSGFDQHWKQSRQNDDASQSSSPSPSYSPDQAERHTSSSSDDESKPEDCSEGASPGSQGSFSRASSDPRSGSGRQRSGYVCPFDGRPWNKTNIRPQAKPAITPRKNPWRRAGLPLPALNAPGKRQASSQTEARAEPGGKSDAAVQCDLLRSCPCQKELSFAHGAETVTSTSKVETAGGQNVPADGAVLQPPNGRSCAD